MLGSTKSNHQIHLLPNNFDMDYRHFMKCFYLNENMKAVFTRGDRCYIMDMLECVEKDSCILDMVKFENACGLTKFSFKHLKARLKKLGVFGKMGGMYYMNPAITTRSFGVDRNLTALFRDINKEYGIGDDYLGN